MKLDSFLSHIQLNQGSFHILRDLRTAINTETILHCSTPSHLDTPLSPSVSLTSRRRDPKATGEDRNFVGDEKTTPETFGVYDGT
ncbi:hypothetical protein HanIR_Chr12g0595571 [Helianthus annuus]|nr:hypothetical protein HanIR_Chr12g0595571 [Helianthus annuus]